MIAALRRHAASCAALLFAGAALYSPVLGYDFVHYDDYELLVLNYGEVAKAENIAGVFWRDAFAVLGPKAHGVYYRPLLVASYGIEARIAGPNPTVFHATNLALHLLASCLAYALFVAFGCGRLLATGLALVFACHPASALVAAWIPCRNESMLAIACMTSALALVAFLRAGKTATLALCVAAYAAALFTKESGGVLLGVLGGLVLLERTGRPGETRRLAWAGGAALAATIGWAALRHIALGQSPVGASHAPANLSMLLVYLGKMLFPVALAPVPHPADTPVWPGIAAAGVLAAAIAFTGRRLVGPPGLGLAWCAAFLLPSLSVPRETWGLEHRIYLPLVGVLLFAGHLLPPGAQGREAAAQRGEAERSVGPREEWRHTPARLAAALAFAVAIAFGIAAKSRLSEFSDPIVYWESAARAAPHSALAASRVAWRYYEAGRIAEVPAAATRALALDDALAEMYLARGIAYAKQGELRVAEPDLLRAVALEPENADAWTNLARVQRLLGRDAESRDSQQRADRLSSGTTPD